jgi:hypothetical protein
MPPPVNIVWAKIEPNRVTTNRCTGIGLQSHSLLTLLGLGELIRIDTITTNTRIQ